MRYLVITDDELVINNIQANNKCIITEAHDVVGALPFDIEPDVTNGLVYICPICASRLMAAPDKKVRFCMECGTKNTEADYEYSS